MKFLKDHAILTTGPLTRRDEPDRIKEGALIGYLWSRTTGSLKQGLSHKTRH